MEDDTWTDLALGTLLPDAGGGSDRARLARTWRLVPIDSETVQHRQDVWADLDRPEVAEAAGEFVAAMDRARAHLATAAKLRHAPQLQTFVLAAVTCYSQALQHLCRDLDELAPTSDGLTAVHAYLADHLGQLAQRERHAMAERLSDALVEVRYVLRIRSDAVGVARDAGQPDAAARVAETFARFRQRERRASSGDPAQSLWLSNVEEQVIDRVAALNPELFADLASFAEAHRAPFDPLIEQFDTEVRTFLAYRSLIAPLRAAGLQFCRPDLDLPDTLVVRHTFDLVLADRLVGIGAAVVRNDVVLDRGERVVVITGPNQGGKTTLARTIGQLHLLAALGLPVPGREVRLGIPDVVLTQFERAEQVADRRSKLENDLIRVAALLERCTPRSVVLLNEMFSSTATLDAAVLGERVLHRLIDAGSLAVYVTFIDELSRVGPAVVSMMSTVDPQDPATRTYQVVRQPADGRAYAIALAARYGLTRDQVLGRMAATS